MGNNILVKDREQNEEARIAGNEIGLKDIVDFLRRNKWMVVIGGAAGLLFSTVYILTAPKKYEAIGQLQMAQFVVSNNISNGNSINNGDSINNGNSEEPAALVQRLRFSTSYSAAVQQSCGMPKDGEFGEYLGGVLEVHAVKNVTNAVEMKVRVSSPDQAKKCAGAIVDMIVEQQGGLIEDRLAGRQEQLLQYQQALREEQQQLEKIKKSELANFGYLAKLDKLSWIRTRIDELQEEALLSKKHPAKLTTPIIVSSNPVSPKKGLLLLLGVSLGSMLGMLYALGREGWRRAA